MRAPCAPSAVAISSSAPPTDASYGALHSNTRSPPPLLLRLSLNLKTHFPTYATPNLSSSVGNAWLGPLLALGVLLITAAFAYRMRVRLKNLLEQHQDKVQETGQRMTVMFVTMQIILILKTTHTQVGGTEVPAPYGKFIR